MIIPAADLKFELLEIFHHLKVPAGGRLSHSILIETWAKTRLRKNDLLQATDYLVAEEVLIKEAEAEGFSLQLTEFGFSRTTELGHHLLRNWLRKIRIRLMLILMRNNYALGPYRRDSDPSE